jgi:hypothetical protein
MRPNQLRQLLAEGKTDRLLAELLRPDVGLDPELQQEVTLLSARYETLARAKRAGTIDFNDENREQAAINAALLEILTRYEKNADLLPAPAAQLRIACTTDRGMDQPRYASGDTMRLFFKVSAACTVRAIYQLADGRLVLPDSDRVVPPEATDRWLEIGTGFEVAEPLGEERLFVFAQQAPFAPLATRADADGYHFITEGLPESLQKTRGFKKKQHFAEDTLRILTG